MVVVIKPIVFFDRCQFTSLMNRNAVFLLFLSAVRRIKISNRKSSTNIKMSQNRKLFSKRSGIALNFNKNHFKPLNNGNEIVLK